MGNINRELVEVYKKAICNILINRLEEILHNEKDLNHNTQIVMTSVATGLRALSRNTDLFLSCTTWKADEERMLLIRYDIVDEPKPSTPQVIGKLKFNLDTLMEPGETKDRLIRFVSNLERSSKRSWKL